MGCMLDIGITAHGNSTHVYAKKTATRQDGGRQQFG